MMKIQVFDLIERLTLLLDVMNEHCKAEMMPATDAPNHVPL